MLNGVSGVQFVAGTTLSHMILILIGRVHGVVHAITINITTRSNSSSIYCSYDAAHQVVACVWTVQQVAAVLLLVCCLCKLPLTSHPSDSARVRCLSPSHKPLQAVYTRYVPGAYLVGTTVPSTLSCTGLSNYSTTCTPFIGTRCC